MDSDNSYLSERERRLDEVVTAYLKAVEAGEHPEPRDWLARYADLAPELSAFFAGQRQVAALAYADTVAPSQSSGDGILGKVRYIGDYELLEEIARGGMGVVYKARQVSLKRLVALKMILAGECAGPQELARFRTEGEAVASLQHPNIVQIYEVGAHEGHPYFSLEYCAGGSLAQKLNGTPLPAAHAAQLAETLARAMHVAHQAGIIHRDLKPANILLQKDEGGRLKDESKPTASSDSSFILQPSSFILKITDFGLAKRVQGEPGALATGGPTVSGAIMGTPSYMAPEQAAGQGKGVTHAADIYALGAILYEMLTGRPPFRAALPLETILMVVTNDPVPPSQFNTKTPRDLETICLKCLRKEPHQRYASAADLAEDLARWQKGEPISARPVSRLERSWRWCRRNPVVAGLGGALGVLLLALAIGGPIAGFYFNLLAERERQAADNERQARQDADDAQAEEALQRQQAEKDRDAKDLALRRAESLRLAAQSSNVLAQDPALALLLAVAGAEQSPPRQLDANNALLGALKECREARTITAAPVPPRAGLKTHVSFTSLAVSRDGKRLATVSDRHQWNGSRDGHPADRELWQQRSVQLRDAQTGEVQVTIHIPGMMIQSAHFSPDGKILATLAEGGTSIQGSNDNKDSKDNKDTLIEFTDWVVRLWDTTSGQELHVLRGHRHRITTLDFSPDGRLLATGSFDHSVCIFDTATGKKLHVLQPEKIGGGQFGCAVAMVRFSADGQRLLTMTDGVHTFWEEFPSQWPRDPPASRVFKHIRYVHNFPNSWGRNGPYRSKGNDASPAQLWDPTSGKLLATLRPTTESKQDPEETTWAGFTTDGREVVTGHWLGGLNRWRASDGRHLACIQGNGRDIANADISTDGSRILVQYPAQTEGKRPAAFALFELASGKELGRWDEKETPTLVRVRGDGRLLLTVAPGDTAGASSPGRTASLRSAETGKVVLELRGHSETITAADFLPDGRQVLTASLDGALRVWPTENGPGSALVLPGRPNAPRRARYRPSPPSAERKDGPNGGQIVTFASPAGRRKVIGSVPPTWERFVELWNGAGQRTAVLQGMSEVNGPIRDLVLGGIVDAEFSPDGHALVTIGEDWLPTNEPPGHARRPQYAPVRVWDTNTGKERYALEGIRAGVLLASFSPDSRLLLTVGDGFVSKFTFDKLLDGGVRKGGEQWGMGGPSLKEPAVRIWDTANGKLVRVLLDHEHECSGAAWSPDGHRILTVARPAAGVIPFDYPLLALWDVTSGKLAGRLERSEGTPHHLQFSPDNKYVAGLQGTNVVFWDAASGKHLRTLAGHAGDVSAATFSPDGSRLVTAGNDRLAIVWDVATGQELHRLAGHGGRVFAVACSADGRWLATASEDGTARLWEAATGREWLTLTGHRGPVHMVTFRPDSQAVLTAGADGTAREWPVDPLPVARKRLPRQLTAEERGRFQVPHSR
jgi:WD40 repeat protein/serine/threonine protein kinase